VHLNNLNAPVLSVLRWQLQHGRSSNGAEYKPLTN